MTARQMRSDMSAAKQVDPSAFKPHVQIEPSEEVPVGCKFLSMGDSVQAVGGRLGVRYVAGSIIADGQVTSRSQREWLNCNEGFILDEESASWETIAGSLNRESRNVCVCVVCCREQSSTLFPTSDPRMQMNRGEVEVEEAKQTRVRRASTLTTDKERNEYEVMRPALRNWCGSCAKGRAKHSHECGTSERSGL